MQSDMINFFAMAIFFVIITLYVIIIREGRKCMQVSSIKFADGVKFKGCTPPSPKNQQTVKETAKQAAEPAKKEALPTISISAFDKQGGSTPFGIANINGKPFNGVTREAYNNTEVNSFYNKDGNKTSVLLKSPDFKDGKIYKLNREGTLKGEYTKQYQEISGYGIYKEFYDEKGNLSRTELVNMTNGSKEENEKFTGDALGLKPKEVVSAVVTDFYPNGRTPISEHTKMNSKCAYSRGFLEEAVKFDDSGKRSHAIRKSADPSQDIVYDIEYNKNGQMAIAKKYINGAIRAISAYNEKGEMVQQGIITENGSRRIVSLKEDGKAEESYYPAGAEKPTIVRKYKDEEAYEKTTYDKNGEPVRIVKFHEKPNLDSDTKQLNSIRLELEKMEV